jgi:hypothetical protein
MPTFILKCESKRGPRYLEYSTIVDAPITLGMTRKQLDAYYRRKNGDVGMVDLEQRMVRVDAKGTSSRMHNSFEDTIKCNRAGKGETRLTVEQFVEYYINKQGRGEQPTGINPFAEEDQENAATEEAT